MNQNESPQVTVGLDIGTTKICALIAAKDTRPGNIKILGIGITESEGLNRGVVVNIDRTVKAIRNVIDQAEQQSGIKVSEVIVGIAGDHIESFQTRGIVSISSQSHEVSQQDVDRLLDEAKKVAIPSERKIIHLIPQEFIIDGQDGIHDPIGMSGVRMEANVHIVTGLATAIENINRCVERAGLKVKDIVLEPLASSHAVLTDDEKEVGVALVDIGGGTTDIAIFEENIIRYTSVFAIAGRQVTDDVKKGLGIIQGQAERIKREYGHSYSDSILKDEVFMIPGIGGRAPLEVSKSYLCKILQARMAEIFSFAAGEIRRSGYYNRLGAGIVITGGTTLLRGSDALAQQIFEMPVKIGIPAGISYHGLGPEIESPVYSTSVGLALYGFNKFKDGLDVEFTSANQTAESEEEYEEVEGEQQQEKSSKSSFINRVKEFLQDL
ncbi:MAG: cell division protein FtsA [Chloroflexota bacterium]